MCPHFTYRSGCQLPVFNDIISLVLGVSLAVGQRTLTPRAEVRILHPQPIMNRNHKPQIAYFLHPKSPHRMLHPPKADSSMTMN
jgi:hypothetical protein